jgi:hypothetical protein
MNKLVRIGFIVVLLLGTTACSSSSKKSNTEVSLNDFLINNSVKLTKDMDQLAEDEELMGIYKSMEEITDISSEIKEQDYDSPVEAYIFHCDLKTLIQSIAGNVSLDEAQMSIMEKKMLGANIIAMVNAREGSTFLAATSVLTANESYLMPDDWESNTLVYLVYDGKYSSLVAFQKTGDGIVSATSYFVKQTDAILESMDMYGFEKEHIGGDDLKAILNK